MVEIYFENIKTGKRFKLIRHDKDANEVVLQGAYHEFREPYDKARFEKLGYRLIKVETQAAPNAVAA